MDVKYVYEKIITSLFLFKKRESEAENSIGRVFTAKQKTTQALLSPQATVLHHTANEWKQWGAKQRVL